MKQTDMLAGRKRYAAAAIFSLALAATPCASCVAQALSAFTPPPGQVTGYFAVGQSNLFQQAAGNYVAKRAGSERLSNGTTVPSEYRFGLPVIFQHPYVPTDMAGPGGCLKDAQELRHLPLTPDRNTLPRAFKRCLADQIRLRIACVHCHQHQRTAIPSTIAFRSQTG